MNRNPLPVEILMDAHQEKAHEDEETRIVYAMKKREANKVGKNDGGPMRVEK